MSSGSDRVIIVGAGPAGLHAAICCAENGVPSMVIDDKPRIGGAVFAQPRGGAGNALPSKTRDQALSLFAEVARFENLISFETGAEVVGWFGGSKEIAYLKDGRLRRVVARSLIVAAGCFERAQPFPGWTLPGSMTLGAAQLQVKAGFVKPGKRAVLAGTGPLLLAAAKQLHEAGVEIAGVFEAGRRRQLISRFSRLLAKPSLLAEGFGYLRYCSSNSIPVHFGWGVVEARGQSEVTDVRVAPWDRNWRPILSKARWIQADCVAAGYGFVPRTEITQLLGCKHRFDMNMGWIPETDAWARSSRAGIYVCGDAAGVNGADAAAAQGRIAAIASMQDQGVSVSSAALASAATARKRLARLTRFRSGFDGFSRLREGLLDLPSDDTVICRCEHVSLAELKRAVRAGALDLTTLKMFTRVGMGDCQGKVCATFCSELLRRETGRSTAEVGQFQARFPLSPLPFSSLGNP